MDGDEESRRVLIHSRRLGLLFLILHVMSTKKTFHHTLQS